MSTIDECSLSLKGNLSFSVSQVNDMSMHCNIFDEVNASTVLLFDALTLGCTYT